jgi:hypothetical protein
VPSSIEGPLARDGLVPFGLKWFSQPTVGAEGCPSKNLIRGFSLEDAC